MTKKIEVFASEALPGELEDFPDIKRGWGTTKESTGGIPPMKWFNSIQNRTDEAINAIAEGSLSGYTFKDGATLDSHKDLIYDDVSKSWYFWIGESGKVIPPNSNASEIIESDGGIWSDTNPSGLWVSVGDASLSGDLLSTNGASLIYTKSGDSVQKRLDVLSSTNELSNIRILTQLPLKSGINFQVNAEYNYTYTYPQTLYFLDDENEMYISWEAVGGDNSWTWFSVYDTTTWTMKSFFSAGVGASEGVYIYRYGGIKYLVTMQQETFDRAGGKTGVYQLPDNIESIHLQRLTPVNIAVTNQRYQLSGYNGIVMMEVFTDSYVNRRNSFVFYNFKDLLTETNPKPIGCFNLDNPSTNLGKRQGIAWHGQSIVTAGGAFFDNTKDYTPKQTVSFRKHLLNGDTIEAFTGSPIDVLNKLKPHLITEPSRLETEGCSFSSLSGEVKPYTILITGSAVTSNAAIGGIVVVQLEERSPEAITLDDIATPNGYYMSNNYVSIFDESPVNVASNSEFKSFKDVLDFMTENSIREYSVYVGSHELMDLAGNTVENYTVVTFTNINTFTYLGNVEGNRVSYKLLITRNGDSYKQSRHAFVYSERTNVRDEYFTAPAAVQGVNGYPCTNYYSASDDGVLTTARFFKGQKSRTLVGSIQIDSANSVTKFNTVSDAKFKIDNGEYTEGLQVLEKLNEHDALRRFTWKSTGVADYGFIAQRLKEVVPKAVSYDEEEDTHFVDYSKLVPDLISAVLTLSDRLKKLES